MSDILDRDVDIADRDTSISISSSTVGEVGSSTRRKQTSPSLVKDVVSTGKAKMVLAIVSGICLLAGSFQSACGKWMNLQVVPKCGDETNPDCAAVGFAAPFWQSWVMYLGEATCMLIYFAGKFYKKHTGHGFGALEVPRTPASLAKKNCNPFWWAIPCLLDLTGTTMINYAQVFTYASTVQVLRNFLILTTAVTQILWFRRPLKYYEWAGSVVVTGGMIITCIYELQNPEETPTDNDNSWIGIVLTLAGTVVNTFQLLGEEAILMRWYCPVLKAVGFEGLFGILFGGIAMLICQFGGWEDEKGSLYQIGHSTKLILANVFYYFNVIGFNGAGLAVTALGSGLLRSVLFSARSIIIWIIELAAKWNTFDWYNLWGLVLCFIGTLWFNNLIRFPCWPKCQHFLESEAGCFGLRLNYTNEEQAMEQEMEEIQSAISSQISSNREVF